jgi:hypothetical protein
MVFAGNGAVRFQLAIVDKTYNGGGVTCNDSTLWNFSGTYIVYGQHLRLDVQGQRTTQDNCNPARNGQIPFGSTHYDWEWVESVAPAGTLLYLIAGSQLGGFPDDNMLLRKTG